MNTPQKAFKMMFQHFQHVYQNVFRITDAGDNRLTDDGNTRITDDSDY